MCPFDLREQTRCASRGCWEDVETHQFRLVLSPSFLFELLRAHCWLTSNSNLEFLVSGADGNLWFTEYDGNKIGRITPDGKITEYAIPTYQGLPDSIAAGPDNNIWFTEDRGKIGRIGTGK